MSIRRTTTTATTASPSVPSKHQSDSSLLTDIFSAYYKARENKRSTVSQMKFESRLSENLVTLYNEIRDRTYVPGSSMCFIVREPVQREVFAASFRDRIVHHYLYAVLEPLFEPVFIYDSYSCRRGKGTLFGVERLDHHIRSCSDNWRKPCYALKLDIEGYFMKIDRTILFGMLSSRIDRLRVNGGLPAGFDYDTVMFLLRKVVYLNPTEGCRIKGSLKDWHGLPDSKSLFKSASGCGLPIGNLTSQLFSNVYLNALDHFVKRDLGFRHYGRYVDDSYIIDNSADRLRAAVPAIASFLENVLRLRLNYRKVKVIPVERGVPFLGCRVSPNGRFLKKEVMCRLESACLDALCCKQDPYARQSVVNSCLGHLCHFNNRFLHTSL